MSLIIGLEKQLRVVHALVLRETRTRFGAYQLGFLWVFFEPLLWVVSFYLVFSIMEHQVPYSMDIVGFITTAIIPILLFRETFGRSLNAIAANKALLFYPQIRPLDLFIARSTLEIATLIFVFVTILAGNSFYMGRQVVDNALTVALGLVLAGLFGSAAGLFFSTVSIYFKSIEKFLPTLISRPLIWLSGLFFTANDLPENIRNILLWNPMLHIVEMVRSGWFVTYQSHYVDTTYVLFWIVGFAYAGLILERLSRRRLELT